MHVWRTAARLRPAALSVAALVIAAPGWGQATSSPAEAAPVSVAQPAQNTASPDAGHASAPADSAAQSQGAPAAAEGSAVAAAAPAKKVYTVPAGTKVLLQLRSAINTKSAKPGDGIYLASTFPVVVGSRVMIPAGVYVQGVVDDVIRPGRVKGRAQLNLHFTSIIFPNGSVVEIPGILNSLPGASDHKVNGEGNIEENGNKGRDIANAAKIGLEGAGVGTIGGAATGHPLEGLAIGGLGGAAVGAAVALFTRGDDINIENGTPVEMVLQRPLLLEDGNLSATAPDGGVGAGLVPSANQSKPLDKPAQRHARVICPPGGLGCG